MKKIILPIGILCLFLIICFLIIQKTIGLPKESIFTKKTPTPAPTAKPIQKFSLTFAPNNWTLTTTSTSSAVLSLQSPTSLMAIDFELMFNPREMKIIDIRSRKFFSKELIAMKKIDNTHGIVNFTIGNFDRNAKVSSGEVFEVVAQGLVGNTKGEITITKNTIAADSQAQQLNGVLQQPFTYTIVK